MCKEGQSNIMKWVWVFFVGFIFYIIIMQAEMCHFQVHIPLKKICHMEGCLIFLLVKPAKGESLFSHWNLNVVIFSVKDILSGEKRPKTDTIVQ